MNPKVENFKITCLNCKGESRIRILNDKDVLYIDQIPIIACRFRGDLKWGFECQCGNDSRLAKEELKDIDTLVQGGEHSIERLARSLKVKDERKFKMVGV